MKTSLACLVLLTTVTLIQLLENAPTFASATEMSSPPTICGSNGEFCLSNDTCCSSVCENFVCTRKVPVSCSMIGRRCLTNEHCKCAKCQTRPGNFFGECAF